MFHRVLSMLLILILANHGKWFLPNNPIFYPISCCLDYWIWANSSEHSVHEPGSFITLSRYIFSGHCFQGILVVLSKAAGGDLLKMVFLKILQISQENTSVRILWHISHLVLMYLMLTLNRLIRTGFRRTEEKRFIMVI